jgi:hypothetical protein
MKCCLMYQISLTNNHFSLQKNIENPPHRPNHDHPKEKLLQLTASLQPQICNPTVALRRPDATATAPQTPIRGGQIIGLPRTDSLSNRTEPPLTACRLYRLIFGSVVGIKFCSESRFGNRTEPNPFYSDQLT